MALTEEQKQFIRGGGVLNTSDPEIQQAYSEFVRSQSAGGSGIITGQNLTPVPDLSAKIPSPPTDKTNYNAFIASGQGIIDQNNKSAPTPSTPTDLNTYFEKYAGSQTPPPSLEPVYQTAYETSGISEAQKISLEKSAAVKAAQAELAGIQAQIQAVINKRDVNNLQLEKQASGGQVVGTILNRQQQEVNRQAAIEALPLQALALAAQAKVASAQGEAEFAQSTLKLAQDKLDTAFKLKSQDAENAYNYQKELRKSIFDFATESEKLRLNQLEKQQTTNLSLYNNAINSAQKDKDTALANGQADIGAQITQLQPPLPTDKDFTTKLQKYNNDVAVLEAKIKPLKTANTEIVEVNGRKILVDKNTGTTIKDLGSTTGEIGLLGTAQTQPYIDAFNSASLGLSAKQMPIAQKKFNDYITGGNFTGAKEYLVRVAMAGATADQQNQAVGRTQALSALTDIKSLLEQAKNLGANTNIVSGNIVNVAQKLGTTNNSDLSYIGSRIQQILQVYRRSLTGVAFSPNEAKEYAKIFPDITNTDKLNTTKLQSLIDAFNLNNRSTLSFYIGDSNYDKIFGQKQLSQLPSQKNLAPKEGDTKDYNGIIYKLIKGIWTPQ